VARVSHRSAPERILSALAAGPLAHALASALFHLEWLALATPLPLRRHLDFPAQATADVSRLPGADRTLPPVAEILHRHQLVRPAATPLFAKKILGITSLSVQTAFRRTTGVLHAR